MTRARTIARMCAAWQAYMVHPWRANEPWLEDHMGRLLDGSVTPCGAAERKAMEAAAGCAGCGRAVKDGAVVCERVECLNAPD